MATITATKAGNWSDTTVWNGGVVPGDSDVADLYGYVIVMDIPTIPVSGTLSSIISPARAGQLTLAMSGANTYAINATTITAGTKSNGGIIQVSGAALSAVLNVTGSIIGGTGYGSAGLQCSSTGTVNISGTVTGGSASVQAYGVYILSGAINISNDVAGGGGVNSYGVYNASTGSVTITGNVTGGTVAYAYGVYNTSTGAVTLNNCNLINKTNAVAYVGTAPTWNLNDDSYVEWGGVKFYQDVSYAELAEAVWTYANRTVTG
jgi:hypothetical protein